MKGRVRPLRPVGMLLVILMAIACKDGDLLSSNITPATPEFQPASVPGGTTSDFVSLVAGPIAGGRIFLDVVVTEIDEPVSGIALKLGYPQGFSKFIGCTDGTLFTTGGGCLASEPTPGQVFIGRSGTGPGNPVQGGRVVVRLEFLVFGVDAAPLVFEGQNLGGSEASAVLDSTGQPIPVQWFAGVLRGL